MAGGKKTRGSTWGRTSEEEESKREGGDLKREYEEEKGKNE